MKKNRNVSDPQPDGSSREILDLDGFMDMGMRDEAIALTQCILSREGLNVLEFERALDAILTVGENPETFRDSVRKAFHGLSAREQRQARTAMLGYYYTIGDLKSANQFTVQRGGNPQDLMFSMDVFLDGNHLAEAKKVFRSCLRLLERMEDGFHQSMLLTAMARYCERAGNLEEAEMCWARVAEFDQPFLRNALAGLVRIPIVRAWRAILDGLKTIEKFGANTDKDTALKLPGNHDELLADAKKELEFYREALDKVVPQREL